MESSEPQPTGLLITQDLFFASKVTGTASALGFHVTVTQSLADATPYLQSGVCRCLIVDLGHPAMKVSDLMASLPAVSRPTVIAFGAHVLAEQLQAAQEAGCDVVLPRSRFSAELPELLKRHLT